MPKPFMRLPWKMEQGNRMTDVGAAFCRQRATKSRSYNTLFLPYGLFAADKNGCFVVPKHSCDCLGKWNEAAGESGGRCAKMPASLFRKSPCLPA
jgi:hypothetical protein